MLCYDNGIFDATSVSMHPLVTVWLSGNIVGHINEVTLCRAGLLLRWVTVLVFTKATQANSAWSSLCV